jgi:aminoglycoside phosphotransferase (APT) family kinase protein
MELCAGADALAMEGDECRTAVGRDYLHWLGRLHTLDAAALPLTALGDIDELDLWAGIAGERTVGWQTPAVAPALDWLGGALPEVVEPVLCHGDAGPGNFLYDGDRVSALLDWEFAHLGDPHDDLAWVFVRNHLLGRPIDVPDALGSWRAATGLDTDLRVIERYRVLVLVRMAISCDATLAWKDGVEDESTRTQILLRPWLGAAIPTALGLAGCEAAWLPSVKARGDQDLTASPHAPLLALIPPLEPIP